MSKKVNILAKKREIIIPAAVMKKNPGLREKLEQMRARALDNVMSPPTYARGGAIAMPLPIAIPTYEPPIATIPYESPAKENRGLHKDWRNKKRFKAVAYATGGDVDIPPAKDTSKFDPGQWYGQFKNKLNSLGFSSKNIPSLAL